MNPCACRPGNPCLLHRRKPEFWEVTRPQDPTKHEKLSYEEYEVYIDAALRAGLALSLDDMRMRYAYYIIPCPCVFPICRGWVLARDVQMMMDLVEDTSEFPPDIHGGE